MVVVATPTEMAIHCRITTRNYSPIGLIEGLPNGPPVASSLNQPGPKRQVIIRCMNTTGVETPQVDEDDP